MDSDNPSRPENANHVILHVDTGEFKRYIEPTYSASFLEEALPSVQRAIERWGGGHGYARLVGRGDPKGGPRKIIMPTRGLP